ncbi:hypothetical protein Nepgr_014251 [Nepenthes gracilis]|uniref:Pseudouridine synthase I TruA alpha/beta domain-containing protein n=1 Tax=Nepenthes gracilis TaxID=150966 RepID=A0AAD3SIT8_NEPGR|nr:hypothetical protein Nepgr_014251 [Nepenthes gracilis]
MENCPSTVKELEPTPKKLKMSTTTTTSGEDDSDTEPTPLPTTTSSGITAPKTRRYKRRKIAIFFAYCGVGYQGMQKNPGAKTIEGDLEEALYLSGAVPEHDRGLPKRFDWARSARTDKGVSAVGQVISGRFYIDPPGLVDRLNINLPSQIRIFGYKRVTTSFNAKKFCDRRRYVYLLPVFALDPSCHRDRESVLASLGSVNELVKCSECSERGRKVVGLMGKRSFEPKVDFSENVLQNNTGVVVSDCQVQSGISSNYEAATFTTETAVVSNQNVSSNESKVVSHEDVSPNYTSAVASQSKVEAGILSNCGAAMIATEPSKISLGDDDDSNMNSHKSSEFEVGKVLCEEQTVIGEERTEGQLNGCSGGRGKMEKSEEFAYGEKEKERFSRILKHYEGTHNFHNFTTRTKAEDPSARRYIVSFNANTTVTVEGIEFVKCEVVGQSFMLHQIRKMIGLAVAIMRNCAPDSLFDTVFQQDVNLNVPTAPEVGLYLDECIFTSYNKRWKDSHEELSMKAYAEEAEDFKMKYIYSHIANTEHNEGVVALWLHSLNCRNYPDLRALDDAAAVQKNDSEVEVLTEPVGKLTKRDYGAERKMGVPTAVRDAWIDCRSRNSLVIASPLEEKKIRDARNCTHEGVRAGAKASAVACVASAIPTVVYFGAASIAA